MIPFGILEKPMRIKLPYSMENMPRIMAMAASIAMVVMVLTVLIHGRIG